MKSKRANHKIKGVCPAEEKKTALCLHKLAPSCEKYRRKYLYPSGNFSERHCLLLQGKSRRNMFRSHCNPNCLAIIGLKAVIQRAAVNKAMVFFFFLRA